jgi:hypothetical protein
MLNTDAECRKSECRIFVMLLVLMPSAVMNFAIMLCNFAERLYAVCFMLSVVMLSVVMLSVVMLCSNAK